MTDTDAAPEAPAPKRAKTPPPIVGTITMQPDGTCVVEVDGTNVVSGVLAPPAGAALQEAMLKKAVAQGFTLGF